jgi:L-threonylcarbamoyladenylate synthase
LRRVGSHSMGLIVATGDPPPSEAVEAAARALAVGDIVGIPTDTVYGLAADPFRTGAADRIFKVKGRPRNVELPVLVAGEDQALALCEAVPRAARRLMERFWPGPLTLVLPRRADLQADLGEDDATIGIRCPGHPVPLAVCRAAGPIATTSANRHGGAPFTTAREIVDAFAGDIALVLDGGTCAEAPSSVVDCTGEDVKLLREGRLAWDHILEVAGEARQ